MARKKTNPHPTVSVIVPVMDEADSIAELCERVIAACKDAQIELAGLHFIDDGSRDQTWAVIEDISRKHDAVSGIRLRRNFGKATALTAGAAQTTGDIIITMDGDLQDDPKEIPRFLDKLADGYDLVSGWKQVRNDPLDKTLPSRLFNKVTAKVSGIDLHDFNCGFKAYRREIFEQIQLYGELHRFVPVLADAYGYRIAEIPVEHHARKHGQSKYGFSRLFKGFLDLFTVVTLTRFAGRPSHLFGGTGLVFLAFGTLLLVYLTLLKIFTGAEIGERPLLLLGILLEIIGVQLVLFGLLAEMIANLSARAVEPASIIAQHTNGKQ